MGFFSFLLFSGNWFDRWSSCEIVDEAWPVCDVEAPWIDVVVFLQELVLVPIVIECFLGLSCCPCVVVHHLLSFHGSVDAASAVAVGCGGCGSSFFFLVANPTCIAQWLQQFINLIYRLGLFSWNVTFKITLLLYIYLFREVKNCKFEGYISNLYPDAIHY